MKGEYKLLRGTSSNGHSLEEKCEIKEIQVELAQRDISFESTEKELLLEEIQSLRSKLQLYSDARIKKSTDKLRSSLLSRSIQLQKKWCIKNPFHFMHLFHNWPTINHLVIIKMSNKKFLTCCIFLHVPCFKFVPKILGRIFTLVDIEQRI